MCILDIPNITGSLGQGNSGPCQGGWGPSGNNWGPQGTPSAPPANGDRAYGNRGPLTLNAANGCGGGPPLHISGHAGPPGPIAKPNHIDPGPTEPYSSYGNDFGNCYPSNGGYGVS